MSLDSVYLLTRWLHFSLLFSLAGCSCYHTLLAPRRYRATLQQQLRGLSGLAAGGTLITAWLLLAAQVGLMGDGWPDILRMPVWHAVLDTGFGRIWRWQLGLPLFSLLALVVRGQCGRWLGLAAALAQVSGLAFTGHAAMLDGLPGTLQRINQLLHLLAAAFWAGGLLPLLWLMADAQRAEHRYDAIRTMMRFSRYGHLAVALVLVSGALDARLILGWPLYSFGLYSQLLLAKAIVVLMMVLIALYNRYWLVPRFHIAGLQAQRRFIVTTAIELMLVAIVLMLVSVFATLAPG